MPTTNFDRWREYNSVLPSPQSYIDWGWMFTIAACLQRRVWIGPEPSQSCFPNMYVILVGKPGIGKGLVLTEVIEFVRHWKLQDVSHKLNGNTAKSQEDAFTIHANAAEELKSANDSEYQGANTKKKEVVPPGLFHVAPDSTTYQAMIEALGECYRSINYYAYSERLGKDVLLPYRHSSTCFVLKELASLMRAKTEDVVNFLLGLYDCPIDYEYRTISRQKDRVRRACVNLIAGTTPSYMQSTFDDRILNEGFSSRTFYIFSNRNKQNKFFISRRTDEQIEHKKHLLEHLFNLSQLCGHVQVEEGTYEFLQEWWDQYESNKALRANKSPKLEAYYSRKNIHVMKIAMAMHFGESVLMTIPLQRFKDAIAFLEREEKNMHLALMLEGNNPMSRATKFVIESLSIGPKRYLDLLTELHRILQSRSLCEECIGLLVDTNQIQRDIQTDPQTQKETIYFKLT